jgi:V/A-type H+-transporting ATPase subunit E
MKGTEKIIAHIRADGDAEAKKIIDAASKQAEEKRAESFKAALSEYEKLMQAGNAECEDILSGSRRIAEMEAKKSVLSVKQEMISAAFDAAREEIVNMPRDKYTQFLARMAAEAAAGGMEEIVLNARDKAEVGKAVCKAANELLSAKGTPGKLTVSEETADISGGVIVRFGGIETNCSIDALIRQRRSGLSTEVAAALFE